MITRLIVAYFLIVYSRAVYAPVPLVSRYNETEAKILLNLTAGAYSTDPEKCVNNTLPKWQKWLICNTESMICDAFQNFCSLYIIRSDVMKEIIIVFRGTTTTKQLIVEGWQSMRSKKNFFNIGMVNRYFLQALDKTWPNIEPVLMNPLFKSYQVKFTGHSLGGAIASLAATRTVIQRLRTGNKIKLITFGEPRTGDYQFAMYHNAHIPFSFRLVHHLDLVPHLPPCEKDANYRDKKNGKSKPCLTGKIGSPYHHGIEIWMDSMNDNSREGSCDKDQNFITNRLPNKNVLIKGRNFEFAIGRLISHGRFGAVYEVLRRTDGRRFAVKLEICDTHSHGLNMDYIVLSQATKVSCEHIASLIDQGKIEGHFKFIVMKMLGDNLHKLRHAFVECHFSLSTSLRLGIQTLAALEELHSMGFVHRDVKASNFAISDPAESKMNVYLIDFGLCRMYRNLKDGIKPPRNKTSFRGTARYASLAAHREEEISPKDDLESWFYMLIEMLSGELPWGNIHRTDRKEIERKKEQCRSSDSLKTLLKDCPKVEFRRILNYIDSLTYHSQPDHKFLTQMLQLTMKNYGVKMDEPYDWDDELQTHLS